MTLQTLGNSCVIFMSSANYIVHYYPIYVCVQTLQFSALYSENVLTIFTKSVEHFQYVI